MRKTIVFAAAILTLGLRAGAQEPAGEAREAVKSVVERTVNSIIDVLKDKANDREARRRKIFAIVDPVTDFALMGKLALGTSHWPKFDEDQRKEYTDSFSRTVRDSCFEKVEIYTNETVTFDPAAPAEKGKVRMLMHILSKGQRYKVFFKLYRAGSSWKIYDLEIEGVSLIRTYGAQYDQVLQKGSPKDLLAKMKSKGMATPDDLKNVGKSKDKK
ncbi:MAG: ABC transporter substrate-binding protein [Elusimicrobia bacterium]|nr:ABC transporter substrate-binding protein [Elusimicrobiota bacterium]